MIPRLRWWIVGLLFAATALNYLDRNVLSVLEPKIQAELHWTPQQYGYITGAFWFSSWEGHAQRIKTSCVCISR